MSRVFERATKTFLGFLEARGKAFNTIKSYAFDLAELQAFCDKKKLDFQKLSLADWEAYHSYLKFRTLKPNSRRRKLMTAKTFVRYLSGRMDVSTVGLEKFVPPEKVEKPPKLVSNGVVDTIIHAQSDNDVGWRNRALLGVLIETGMLVTEALALCAEDCEWKGEVGLLQIHGKRARIACVSNQTARALQELSQRLQGFKYFFHGYTRAGPLPEKMTVRGVELLFKTWAKEYGLRHFHPRTLRHLFVVGQLLSGKTEQDIMRALSLKTPYAFRVYRPLLEELKSSQVHRLD